jgi:purine-nucleoside phosphorylase
LKTHAPDNSGAAEFQFTNEFIFVMLMSTIKMKKKDPSVVIPHKIRNLNRSRAFFIPADTPSRSIKKQLEKSAQKKQPLMFSHLFLLKKSVVFLGGIGAPAAVLAVEPLILSGIKEIIMLGFCGGLTEKTKLFDVFLIDTAFSEEGTSSFYFADKNEFASSEKLNKEIEQKFKSNHFMPKKTSIVSTDAPYREIQKWIDLQQKKGAELVDMEASAVFALAEYHEVEAAAVMVVSDVIKSDSHHVGFNKAKFSHIIKQTFFPFFYE